jgi:hypothetical protein
MFFKKRKKKEISIIKPSFNEVDKKIEIRN